MSEEFKHTIVRRKTKMINVGNVKVGGYAKITVQSMTNTLTTDIKATINQIHSLEAVSYTHLTLPTNVAV